MELRLYRTSVMSTR